MSEGDAPTLYVTDDTGNYVEYTPPEPAAFHETLPEDIRESEHLKDVKDGAELARYYVDLKSNYLRAPDTPDGYEFEKPDGFDLDTDTFSEFKKIAHESGINQKQFEDVMKLEVARQQRAQAGLDQKIAEARENAERELKAEWGDNYERKLDAAKRFLNHEKIVDQNFKTFLEETRFGDNPQVVRFFSKLSELISEDSFVKPGSGDSGPPKRIGEDGRPLLHFPSMENK